MGFKYTRVRDKHTGHEYDVLSHRVDYSKHERVDDDERWPDSNHPRAPRHNVKGPRPTKDATSSGDDPSDVVETADAGAVTESPQTPVSRDEAAADEAQGAEPAAKRSTGRTAARSRKSQD